MAFLHRQRSHQVFHNAEQEAWRVPKPLPLQPSPAAIENVPLKHNRQRTSSNMSASRIIMRRVSSVFKRKKAPAGLELTNTSVYNNGASRRSYSSSRDSLDSVDDIRRPSGLGRAASISSNQSLPPSPFVPSGQQEDSPFYTFPGVEYQRTRATSSPNLLSLSLKVRPKARRASILASPVGESPLYTPPPPKAAIHLPEEIVVLILSHLPRQIVALCAVVSRLFVSVARISLYSHLDTDSVPPAQLEKLIAILASRNDLTDLVTTFVCDRWPSFFLSDIRLDDSYVIRHHDALLTATFTLALQRMSSLTSLTLPAFDLALLAHHTAFGLKSLTFLNHTTSEAETKALFAWLDGQTNITSLRFPNLEDTHHNSSLTIETSIPIHDRTRPGAAPSTPYLKPISTTAVPPFVKPTPSPRSARVQAPSSLQSSFTSPFTSSTLLPYLSILHATPALLILLSPPSGTTTRRPLKSVSLNINTTLYSGLRPAALMSSLRGITSLTLSFSDNVDRRSFEKVLGAAGALLGSTGKDVEDDPFLDAKPPEGLHSLEISVHTGSGANSGRDEALYKSLQASLPRYKALSSLRLVISSTGDTEAREPSAQEQTLIDSWVKLCPTLGSVALFSNARWQRNYQSPRRH